MLVIFKGFWPAETGFFVAIWLFFMAGARNRLFRDPGTFWHTVVGRQILESGRFPDTDSFSFTFFGHPWIPHQWLGECVMAVLDGIGGLDTLLLATATVLAGLYTWLAHRLLRSGLHWLPTVLVTMLTVAASANHLHVRPHISTIIFTGLTFGWLCDFEAARIGLRRLWWLVPIFWIWSNMHGGVLGGLATIVLALSGWCVFRLVGLDSPIVRSGQALVLVLLVVACVLTFGGESLRPAPAASLAGDHEIAGRGQADPGTCATRRPKPGRTAHSVSRSRLPGNSGKRASVATSRHLAIATLLAI